MTAVEWLFLHVPIEWSSTQAAFEAFEQAKQMEKEKNTSWNAFLEREKTLSISDVKTIERIQWYYNQYYNETYGKD